MSDALNYAAGYVATGLRQMLGNKQLDPYLGPAAVAATRAIAGLTDVAATGVARAVPYAPHGFLLATDATLLYGVIKEGYAAATHTCHP